MIESFAPPDIELALVSWLSSRLPGVRVATTVPNPRPGRLVQVDRIGGVRSNLVQDAPIVLVQVWADSGAAGLAHEVYRHLDAMEGRYITDECLVYSVRVSGPVNNPDTSTGTPRYHLTGTLRTRMHAKQEEVPL